MYTLNSHSVTCQLSIKLAKRIFWVPVKGEGTKNHSKGFLANSKNTGVSAPLLASGALPCPPLWARRAWLPPLNTLQASLGKT